LGAFFPIEYALVVKAREGENGVWKARGDPLRRAGCGVEKNTEKETRFERTALKRTGKDIIMGISGN